MFCLCLICDDLVCNYLVFVCLLGYTWVFDCFGVGGVWLLFCVGDYCCFVLIDFPMVVLRCGLLYCCDAFAHCVDSWSYLG